MIKTRKEERKMKFTTYRYVQDKQVCYATVKSTVSKEELEKTLKIKVVPVRVFEADTEPTEYRKWDRHECERFLENAPIVGDIELTTVVEKETKTNGLKRRSRRNH